MHGSSIDLEWWKHPLFLDLDLVAVSCASSKIKLLKLVWWILSSMCLLNSLVSVWKWSS